jgi:hypothetical protein
MVKQKPAPQEKGGKKRKKGERKRHQRHERVPFPSKQVDTFVEVMIKESRGG